MYVCFFGCMCLNAHPQKRERESEKALKAST